MVTRLDISIILFFFFLGGGGGGRLQHKAFSYTPVGYVQTGTKKGNCFVLLSAFYSIKFSGFKTILESKTQNSMSSAVSDSIHEKTVWTVG